ncbi:MAG: monomethylamine:corrinoid methyltransferase [Chloroflexi bacterium]|nr:monomethylamine:corrinoid methyltransferase [Chloroflexota bacterium]
MQLAFIARQIGLQNRTTSGNILGGHARNAEETAILSIATLLAQLSYSAGVWALLASVDREGHRSGRATMQAQSGASRAAERNVGVPVSQQQLTKNGLGSALAVYEVAALVMEQTCSGASSFWSYPCHPGPHGEIKSDLDYELVTMVARAVSGMERDEANGLLNKVLGLYEGTWDQPEKGKRYSYYYDLRTLTPSPALADIYRRGEEELIRLGVPLLD